MHPGDTRPAARLTALYEAYAADTFRYALHVTGRREDAEDVVQFVFLQAYALLESGRDLVNPRAWLLKATKHRSLNVIRDRRAVPSPDLPGAASYDPDPAEAEALAGVRAALWALPESQHHAFVLRHWSGLSQDEIADVLSTTPGAVESLLVRARTALLQERQEGAGECAGVRRRLAGALALSGEQRAHVSACRRCRTARTRLLRASEFATALALLPRPHVAHAIASAVPGFGTSTVASAATATGATGAGGGAAGAAGGGGAGAGAATATASVATKATVLTKVAIAAATAVVAVGAAHPVRSAVAGAVLGGRTAQATASAANSAAAASGGASSGGAGTAGEAATPGSPAAGGQNSASGPGQGKAKGKAAGAGASGTSNGKSSTAGSNGKGKGGSAAAANGTTHGKAATAGSNGKSATAGSNGKSATAGSNGKSATSGKGKAAGSAGSSGTSGSAGKSKGSGKG